LKLKPLPAPQSNRSGDMGKRIGPIGQIESVQDSASIGDGTA
jgi:hypothetical protein